MRNIGNEKAQGSKEALLEVMRRRRLVAVIRSRTRDDALSLARAAARAGISLIEITTTVPEAFGVIEELAAEGGLQVGAGTVLSADHARRAIGAGARFVVAPSLELELIPICRTAGVLCIPGAATPTEIVAGWRAGADLVKLFPADLLGGPGFVRQMLGPFPQVRFVVSGGVDRSNVQDYVRLGVLGICLGSAFLERLLATEGTAGFSSTVGGYVELVERALEPPKESADE
ncbi:MAG TPA: bifunctional 4-hydroxy-2-oxoglutarate aldolase/2-dehydro-3-deoxy-phosphogluconate aldolase [Candidatus Eisenbacteria bacterium]|nr:bifunctional 4-hydroxy-2-oxoglutarate aldolase/2-dehydro-3-deoxy-phosphogluconate aldolase [Candidatus Eisenbacteria bacterium]